MTYRSDREFSDRFLGRVAEKVGPFLLKPTSFEVDTKEAGDLSVLYADVRTIGVRVRGPGYADRYPYDVTFRARRDSGVETELAKLLAGWGDWFFYGHAVDERSDALVRWVLLDLNVWRAMINKASVRGGWKNVIASGLATRPIPNGDGTHFVSCDVRNFPLPMIVGSSFKAELAASRAA